MEGENENAEHEMETGQRESPAETVCKKTKLSLDKGEILMSFASDHALEQRTPIVSHHDTIKW
ncbi:MAG TPA: hypothetical protein VF783_00510, partial [Terriglobales bacterium]